MSVSTQPAEQLVKRRVLVHGHRGARARFPENTMPGFEYAISHYVDAIEMDLAVTKDGALVISHDPVLATGEPIRKLTLGEVNLPTLDDVLRLAPRAEFQFNIEIKSFPDRPEYSPAPDEFAALVLRKIRQYHVERRAMVQSFDFRPLAAMRALAPEIRLGALVENDAREFVEIAAEAAHAEYIAPEYRLVTRRKVDAAHAAGLQVIAWTVNTRAHWEMLIRAGVDGIITDDPEALIAYLATRP